MLAEKIQTISEEEYLEMERVSEIKHEYHEGEIFAMAGASDSHNLITANVIREIGIQLKTKNCFAYVNDMKIRINKFKKYLYPDIMVVCGEKKFFDNQKKDALLDANLIVEVLSDSTEAYDRGDKFRYYRQLNSLKEYLLISQKEKRVEKYLKNETGFWMFSETNEDQPQIILESIDCKLNLEDIYQKVDFIPQITT
ncbi:MAG: Uma2 family endonuclease [Desulfobacterales bacterium]|nr:Uma2 family endonuclease [Desulfobacterales bacterium]